MSRLAVGGLFILICSIIVRSLMCTHHIIYVIMYVYYIVLSLPASEASSKRLSVATSF